MADNQIVMLPADIAGRQQLAAEMRELAKHPLDRAKRPGGYYLNEQGQPIDAQFTAKCTRGSS